MPISKGTTIDTIKYNPHDNEEWFKIINEIQSC